MVSGERGCFEGNAGIEGVRGWKMRCVLFRLPPWVRGFGHRGVSISRDSDPEYWRQEYGHIADIVWVAAHDYRQAGGIEDAFCESFCNQS